MNETIRAILTVIGVLIVVLTIAAGLIWLERRLLAVWQDRYGPNRVGPFGLLQVLADSIKIFMKEDWIPPFVDTPVFILAPAIVSLPFFCLSLFSPWPRGSSLAASIVACCFFFAFHPLGFYT